MREADEYVQIGFPDIASNGAWFSIAVDGELSQVFGTSCAAPTIAAILALINGERIKVGKSSVGFVNPTLYAYPEVLNDITEGQNPVCSLSNWAISLGAFCSMLIRFQTGLRD